jgi:hypothetical protein
MSFCYPIMLIASVISVDNSVCAVKLSVVILYVVDISSCYSECRMLFVIVVSHVMPSIVIPYVIKICAIMQSVRIISIV